MLDRKQQMGLTINNIATRSKLGNRTVPRFLAGEDVKISTVEKVTDLLGLDFAGNEMTSIDELRRNRAKDKALYLVSLMQDTSSLEEQGLDNQQLNQLIAQTQQQLLEKSNLKKLWAN